jgi:non-specific serine/threonine protein kinase
MVTPERVFQVDDRTWRPGEHSTSADPDDAASLPLPVNPFFGRLEELTRLRVLLLDHNPPHHTHTRPPPSRKTRLALQIARELRESHEGGGPWFVPLADVTDAMWIADAIRDAMRLARSPTQPALELVAQALRDRPSVLVLDNLEHLSDAGAAVVQDLFERAPLLQCLVTSRRLLGVAGEREVLVLPLETPAVADSPERVMRFAAVQLFVDRVQAVRP